MQIFRNDSAAEHLPAQEIRYFPQKRDERDFTSIIIKADVFSVNKNNPRTAWVAQKLSSR